jgi:ribosome-associated protein
MAKVKKLDDTQLLVDVIIKGLQDVKGEDIVSIDMRKLDNAVTAYFVICTGNSNTHVAALGSAVEREVRKTLKDRAWHTEGYRNAEWVLLDYINVVVHIFQKEQRDFYNLEGLWADAEITKVKQA